VPSAVDSVVSQAPKVVNSEGGRPRTFTSRLRRHRPPSAGTSRPTPAPSVALAAEFRRG
jgi:hypothetical protein